MTGLSLADVIVVLQQPRSQFILCVALGGIAYLLGDAWQHRSRKTSWTPAVEPISEAEIRAIFQSSRPQSFSLPARKGFKTDYQHTVVPFSKERTH